MINSKLRLITTKVSLLDLASPPDLFELANCGLKWKQNKLWVKALDHDGVRLPAMTHPLWLQDCLYRSQVEAVCLDSSISQLDLDRWLTACAQINKPVFLRLSSSMPPEPASLRRRFKRLADWSGALLLLLGLSPLWLAVALWMQARASEPIWERQWRVGQRGKLFQMLKLRRPAHAASSAGGSQHRCLEHLPQLLNVLAGEMSLVGPRPWQPPDALRYPDRLCLNVRPGISGLWPPNPPAPRNIAESGADQLSQEKGYLHDWSLSGDFWHLTRAVRAVVQAAFSKA